jgi:iron complex transport system substrate-binding protein
MRPRARPLWGFVPIFRALCVLALVVVSGCAQPSSPVAAPAAHGLAKPMRVVSLDYCADQFVLKLADREQILGVSPDATKAFSYMRKAAVNVPIIRSRDEDVLAQRPDLVVRAYGGGPNVASILARSEIPVAQLGYSQDFKDIETNIRTIAASLGHPERGQILIDEMNARLAKVDAAKTGQTALYVTPSGITSGPGSLINVMMERAGLQNFEPKAGWRSIPLERLTREQPDMMVTAFFDTKIVNNDVWSPTRHPIAARALEDRPLAELEGAWTACGGWFLVDGVEAIAKTRAKREARP